MLKWFAVFAFAWTLAFMVSCGPEDTCNIACYNGVCLNNSCDCSEGYEGDSCTILSNEKWIGNWDAIDSCETGTYNYTATIAASSNIVNQIVITNFGEYGTGFYVVAEISGLSFTIPVQDVQGVKVSGSGTIDTFAKKIVVHFTIEDQLHDTDVCTGYWKKQ